MLTEPEKMVKEKHCARVKAYYKKYPWKGTLNKINFRCNTPTQKYYKRGIKNFLTEADLKYLWDRDNASSLKQPSIDRIDSSKNYTLDNCRYIELRDNQCTGGGKFFKNKVKQYSLEGKFIKEWDSILSAAKGVKGAYGNISRCCKGKCNTAYGYIWKYGQWLQGGKPIPTPQFILERMKK